MADLGGSRDNGDWNQNDSPDQPFERHYRLRELAELWGLSRQTVRSLVKDEPAVVRVVIGKKKALTLHSVPESVARRVYTRLTSTTLASRASRIPS